MGLPRLQAALALHQSGDLAKASAVYREILDQTPHDAMALHYLGVIAHQTGRTDDALTFMRQSIEASPRVAEFHCNLGVLLRDCRRLDESAAALAKAIQLRPRYPEALSNLGDVLRQQGRLAEAESALRQSIAIKPSASALLNLGLVLTDAEKFADAARALRDALKLNPNDTRLVKSLGVALLLGNKPTEAATCFRAAVAADERDADGWFGLGNALRALNKVSGAQEAYGRALPLAPDQPDLLINLAATLTDAGEANAAIQIGCRAVTLRPSSPQAKYNLSLALLTSGNLADGWKLYESRWKCPGYDGTLVQLPQPTWDGNDLTGKTIFIRAEQGCGDTIQFVRYLPMLAKRGARIIFECQPELKSLLRSVAGVAKVITRNENPGDFDCHLPLLSLPLHFGTTLETIPAEAPYLHINPARVNDWKSRLSKPGFKCGLVWRGSPNHRRDKDRSIELSALAPLSDADGVQFFSLQKKPVGKEEQSAFPGLVDLSPDLHDFADTAAALTQMDLIISVDTAVAHLAGALGRPVWMLLPYSADWRWMKDRADSPWYPTMRLFRQTTRGEWSNVIASVASELVAFEELRNPRTI